MMASNLLDTVYMSDVTPPPVQTLDFDDVTLRGRKTYNLNAKSKSANSSQ